MASSSVPPQEPVGFSCCGNNAVGGRSDAVPSGDDETELALAKEMNELTVQERERVFDDVHGVAEVREESPEFVADCIEAMDRALAALPKIRRKALDRALFFKPSIETDKKFKLMFLRADVYDATKAAKRMAKYFDEKLLLFGEAKLAKRITLDDLTAKDVEKLNFIGCVILPNRDQAGRPIWFFDMTRYKLDELDSMCRSYWYQVMVTLEDETAQLKGICDVAYCPGDLLAMPASMQDMSRGLSRAGGMMEGLPCRLTTFQICYNDDRVRYLVTTFGKVAGKNARLRIRTHFGSDLEIQYSLMTYGIFCHYLFRNVADDGKRHELHQLHIQRRRDIELEADKARIDEETRSGIILHPQPDDILVGRGRPYQDYLGNQRMSRLVKAQSKRYRSTEDKFGKSCIIWEVLKKVGNYNGRFLRKTPDGGWKVASDKVAREKIWSAFRSNVGRAVTSDDVAKQPLAVDDAEIGRSSKRAKYESTQVGGRKQGTKDRPNKGSL